MFDRLPPALGGGAGGQERRAQFRRLLQGDEPIVVPGVFDALTGVMVERSGYRSCYLTGAGVANTQLAVPDVGLLTFDAIVNQALRLTAATELPVIVDVDTGFGGPTSVMHVVRTLETVGVAAIQMEDQQMPKRCGHFDRKRIVSTAEMQAKVHAATAARSDDNFVVIARTDAIAVEGFGSAVRRANAYREAGADVVFVEAPVDLEQIRRIPQEVQGVPLLMNVVQGGRTPELSADELGRIGYRIVLHANLLMRSMASAGLRALEALKRAGGAGASDVEFLTWEQRQNLVRLPEFDQIEDDLHARWSPSEVTAGSSGD